MFNARRQEFFSNSLKWMREFESLNLIGADITRRAEKAVDTVKALEGDVQKIR